MTVGADQTSAFVLARWGLGARPGDLQTSGRDHIAMMLAEISPTGAPQPHGGELPSASEALAELDEFRTETRKRREAVQSRKMAPDADAPNTMTRLNETTRPGSAPAPMQPYPQRVFRAETLARLDMALAAPTGFAERWVWFWSNHFCVSATKGQALRVLVGNYERTVIRPHAFGSFVEMLQASAHHPAMQIYLDNRQSIGPNSRAGTRRARGLNENLAREILELHTLGVDGGYTQADVTSLAKMLTGWTVVGPNDEEGEIGDFRFNANRHEPGPQTLLGRSYADTGLSQAESALEAVARHSSTAKHIAMKLARHFIADVPPRELVAKLADVFARTNGDLAALARALLTSREATEAPAGKLRSPLEFIIAGMRATGSKGNPGVLLNGLNALGQPLWSPIGPNGFPDTEDHWASPEGLKVRLEVAATLARAAGGGQSPSEILAAVLGPRASTMTQQAVARAESRAQGLALLMMSPEFQRR